MLLVKSQHADLQISLGEIMSYSLTPVPPSLGTDDGIPLKKHFNFFKQCLKSTKPLITTSIYLAYR